MKIKGLVALMSMLCLMAAGASAQGWLNNVVNRAKDKAKEKIEEKIEEKVDQAIDESMEALENKKNNISAMSQPSRKRKIRSLKSFASS